MTDFVKTYTQGKKVWSFEWPDQMSDTEKQDKLASLNDILKDMEENPDDYEFNLVDMAAVSLDLSKMQTVVCLVQYNAFYGYVKDVRDFFSSEFNLKAEGAEK